jgi:probable addiction module antidote protein
MTRTSKFDVADYLKTPEQIAAYLTEALETGDTAFVCTALDTIARAKGMSNVAKATGLGRESLYKSLSGTTKPEYSFGVKLVAQPIVDEKNVA